MTLDVLVGCEFSGTVREQFRKRGHNAWSCDLLPADEEGDFVSNHFQMDVIDAIASNSWDIIILHPPCTALAVSGNRWYGEGMPRHSERGKAIEWTTKLWATATARCHHVALENPVGVLSKVIGRPAQYIQPYEFGHSESKKTGLWLHGLPKMRPTHVLNKPAHGFWDNQTPSGQNKLSLSEDRWKIRSKTYTGIAEAMADQWSQHVTNHQEAMRLAS